MALTGVAVLVLAIVTGTLYMGARSNKAQIEAFAEVGEGMESISIIGQSGLLAIADAQASRMAAADIEEEDGEGGESDEEDTNGKKEVLLNLTSIQKDLRRSPASLCRELPLRWKSKSRRAILIPKRTKTRTELFMKKISRPANIR